MTFQEFFRLDQEQWFRDFREQELPTNFSETLVHSEFLDEDFEFADIP